MQRDECGASGKTGIGERHGDRVAGDHPNIAAAQSQTQCLRHAGIGLDGGETKDLRAQKVGREDWLGPNLQNVVAQFRAGKNPRYPVARACSASEPSCISSDEGGSCADFHTVLTSLE